MRHAEPQVSIPASALATDLSNYVGDVAAIQSAIRNGQLPDLGAPDADVQRVRRICNAVQRGRY